MKTSIFIFGTFLNRIPSPIYLALAVVIFSAANAVTTRIIELGQAYTIDGRNPISLCNVLFVGNLCALGLMILIFYPDWQLHKLKKVALKDWRLLTITAILSRAIAPALMFTALGQTNVTNVVLIGRLEPIFTLILSVFLLKASVNRLSIVATLISFIGVAVTVFFDISEPAKMVMNLDFGLGESLVAIAAFISAITTILSKQQLQSIPVSIFTVYRSLVGTFVFFWMAVILYGFHHFVDVFAPILWQWMLVYGAIIVVLGQLAWLAGLKSASFIQINLASLVTPILAIIFAYLILQETPTESQYLGGILLLLGAILSFIDNLQTSKREQTVKSLNPRQLMDTDVGFRGI
ncbi:DMT family transporter [Synechocystis salina]|uniref:DMT family transporter n=1 Tax=Synechocystis salina LEGE 00031 TaxID=1828736 RepID=A0ABR9VXZ9_9SYNC|nr:DMT family transporter [Synechocystis salina]MBE9242015.1 DMT family transporter [Synechocystis salina LEGE 00041]MBE9255126.1 DMT family transporter [Synechocystis salina LEGE 00031]